MHDAIQLERLGVPSTVVHTSVFEDIRTAFARTLGAAGYPAAVVPHPMATRSLVELERIAADVVPRVVELLTDTDVLRRYII